MAAKEVILTEVFEFEGAEDFTDEELLKLADLHVEEERLKRSKRVEKATQTDAQDTTFELVIRWPTSETKMVVVLPAGQTLPRMTIYAPSDSQSSPASQ